MLNLVWFLFIYQKFIVKNLRYFWEKTCSIHYLHFSFEKHVPSQVLKDFLTENLETISSTFLSKFSSEIYLSGSIHYWGNILTLYLTREAFSLVCVVFVFFSFLSSIFCYRYFPWQTLTNHRIAGTGEGILFFVYHFYPITNFALIHRGFYHLFVLDLFIITKLIADDTCSR